MEMDLSDNDLAKAAQGGDFSAFSELLERHYDRIFRVSAGILGQKADAEDLTQDICASLAGKLKNYRGDALFTTWLHRVTVNAARDRLRRYATHAKAAKGWGDWEINRTAQNNETQEAVDWLKEAMTSLSPDLRETVALVLGEETTHKEAGKALGISEGTVSWRMGEVKKALSIMAKREEMLR